MMASGGDRPARQSVSGVLVPLPPRGSSCGEQTLGEQAFGLVCARSSVSSHHGSHGLAQTPAAAAFRRAGGQIFAPAFLGKQEHQVEHAAGEEAAPSLRRLPSSSPSPSPPPSHARGASFQLYAHAADNPTSPNAAAAAAHAGSATLGQLVHGLTSRLGAAVAPEFVPFSSASRPTPLAEAGEVQIQSMHVHPSLPVLALAVEDEVQFFDITGDSSTTPALGGAAGAVAHQATSIDRGVVSGTWVNRVLRHPFMAGTRVVRFNSVGGNLVAAGTASGLVCLWQLLSVPSASASGATLSGATRRHGAWLFVLQDAHHAGRPVDSLEFSPCGRWLVSASSTSSTFLVWDVTRAIAAAASGAPDVAAPAATPMSKFASCLLEPGHGVQFISFSPDGAQLAVAARPSEEGSLLARAAAALTRGAVRTAKTAWEAVRGGNGKRRRNDVEGAQEDTPTAAATLPAGTLTVWNTHNWTYQTWQTSSPLTSISWSRNAMLLLTLAGSHLVQSLHLSPAALQSPLANASVRINCAQVDGLPTTRDITSAAEGELERFRVGGRISRAVWSPSESRLAVSFESDQEGAELVALFAMRADDTATYQVLPVGMVRGPPCPCQGKIHQHQAHAVASSPAPELDAADAAMEAKYAESPTVEKVYPSLGLSGMSPSSSSSALLALAAPVEARVCREPNTPQHMSFMPARARAHCERSAASAAARTANPPAAPGELLVVSWKFGQITTLPLYFAQQPRQQTTLRR